MGGAPPPGGGMMRIRMLENAWGSPNGARTQLYEKDVEYEIQRQELLDQFLDDGVAVLVEEEEECESE